MATGHPADRFPHPRRTAPRDRPAPPVLMTVLAAIGLLASLVATAIQPGQAAAQDTAGLILPEGYPAAVSVDGTQYTFDRPSPLTTDGLEQLDATGDLALYGRDGFDGVYADAGDGALVRYVPSRTDDPATPCLSERPGRDALTTDDATYAYAGPEPDLTPTDLIPIPGASLSLDDADAPISILPDGGDVPAEYWAESAEGLERFVAVDGDGVPPQLAGPVTVGDRDLSDPVDVTDSVDLDALDRVGCAGPFPAFVDAGDDAVGFVLVGDRLFSFTATASEAESTPSAGDDESVEPSAVPSDETDSPAPSDETESAAPSDDTGTASPSEEPSADASAEVSDEPAAPETEPVAVTDVTTLPAGYPGNVRLDAGEYLFDRIVPLDPADLTGLDPLDGNDVYGPAGGETDRIFVQRDGGPLARYLALNGTDGEATCLVDAASFQPVIAGDATYVFAGIDPDLTPDLLDEIGGTFDINGQSSPIYVDDASADPFLELFADTPDGLYRFTLIGDGGAPLQYTPTFAIGDQTATLTGDETATVDLASLVRVGCVGAFPVYGASAEGPFTQLYLAVSQSVIAYEVTGGSAPPATPATPEPTATTAPTATATATLEPTATATLEPTATATVEPTATATATATATTEPTGTATIEATEAAEPTATLEPTATTEATASATATTEPTATVVVDVPLPTGTTAPTATIAPTGTPEPTATTAPPTPTAPRVLQPVAIVPTVAPGITPAAVTVVTTTCTGPIGQYTAEGYPDLLPRLIQTGGISYGLSGFGDAGQLGTLTRIGCGGGFEIVVSDQIARDATLFLRVPVGSVVAGQPTLFRYDRTLTFTVRAESARQPALISDGTRSYTATATWQRSTYSSVSVELYVADPAATSPATVYARRVDGGAIGTYSLVDGTDQRAAADVAAAGAAAGLNDDLTLGADRYVLTALWSPVGATSNGFVTLYGPTGDASPTTLLGFDPRSPGLIVFTRPA